MASSLTRKVDLIDYVPGGKLFEDVNGRESYNAWMPGSFQPSEGDASLILDHISYLLPEERDRNHFLDCLAHAAQHPAEKLRHMLLLIGKQGTGKVF